jgi:hypothetical protein
MEKPACTASVAKIAWKAPKPECQPEDRAVSRSARNDALQCGICRPGLFTGISRPALALLESTASDPSESPAAFFRKRFCSAA